jgi:SAM-dependent methyltransferase
VNYGLAYAIGFHPWEDLAEHPPFARTLLELVASEEAEPPHGAALDLGTGSGVWGLELAKRGWEVTGVDVVEKALRRARARVEEAGVEMRLVHGDVTALREADVGSGFRLVLDTGTFHGLADAQRAAMGEEVTAVARSGRHAHPRLLRAAPTSSAPFPRGRSRASRWRTASPTPWRGCSASTSASTGCGGDEQRRAPGPGVRRLGHRTTRPTCATSSTPTASS